MIFKTRLRLAVLVNRGYFFINYLKLEGKPTISETLTRFEVDKSKYLEVMRYNYKKSKGIWWFHRIHQTLKQDDHILQTYIIKLSDLKPVLSPKFINKPCIGILVPSMRYVY